MKGTTTRVPALVLCGIVAASLLAGCADSRVGPTLAETKASAQLLRNNVLATIDPEKIIGFVEWKDTSRACADAATDPEGLMRQWYSGGVVPIAPAYITDTASIMKELAASYEAEGWSVSGEGDDVRVLTRENSTSRITLSVVPLTGQLKIESEGPCVATDGPDSDEVKQLERL